MSEKFQNVVLHPASIKYIKKGHPWIIKDTFTERFPKNELLLNGIDDRGKFVAQILQDKKHKRIKARVWKMTPEKSKFSYELAERIEKNIEGRLSVPGLKERDFYYLSFGEADLLPGLFILKLDKDILIQSYTSFWKNYRTIISDVIKSRFPECQLWWQNRGNGSRPKAIGSDIDFKTIKLKEFGVNFQIALGKWQDFGWYPDMTSVRAKLSKELFFEKSVLNLFSYTGAFSLQALKEGAKEVHSVDLSGEYLSQLETNLSLNDFDATKHQSHELSCEEYLEKNKKSVFDTIISDPPSFSSDGKKSESALHAYDKYFSYFYRMTKPGSNLILFLNTHTVSAKKFREKIESLAKNSWAIEKRFSLGDDCPTYKGFPEGDYLKGLLLRRL